MDIYTDTKSFVIYILHRISEPQEKEKKNMKCVQCDRDATYIFRGMSYCDEHFKNAREREKPITHMSHKEFYTFLKSTD